MPKFGNISKTRLASCHYDLVRLFNQVVQVVDCSVIEGHRSQETQDKLFTEGRSKVEWPNSRHNATVSKAVDVAPYINGGISWQHEHCIYLAGVVIGIASMQA